MEVLSSGLTFCPTSSLDRFEFIKVVNLFARRLTLKVIYNKSSLSPEDLAVVNLQKGIKKSESRAIRDLVELLYESGDPHDNFEFDYNTGEFLEVVYTTPETEQIPLKNKSSFTSKPPLLCCFRQKID